MKQFEDSIYAYGINTASYVGNRPRLRIKKDSEYYVVGELILSIFQKLRRFCTSTNNLETIIKCLYSDSLSEYRTRIHNLINTPIEQKVLYGVTGYNPSTLNYLLNPYGLEVLRTGGSEFLMGTYTNISYNDFQSVLVIKKEHVPYLISCFLSGNAPSTSILELWINPKHSGTPFMKNILAAARFKKIKVKADVDINSLIFINTIPSFSDLEKMEEFYSKLKSSYIEKYL